MTYKEALESGYKELFTSWQRKYISRKININEQPIIAAGGVHKGLYYVELPTWNSTQYSIRQYLKPPKA